MSDRPRERWLLAWLWPLLALLYSGLAGHRVRLGQPPWHAPEVVAVAGYLGALWLLHRALVAMDLRGDEGLVPIAGLLTSLGLIVRLRLMATPLGWDGLRSLLVYPVALATLAAAVWVCRRRLHWLDSASWLCGLAAVGLLWFVIHHGRSFRGALYGPGLTTPSELLKPLLVIFLAGFLKRRRNVFELLAFTAIWAGVALLLFKQSDLGMVVILSGLSLSLFFVATGRARFLLIGLTVAAMAALALHLLAPVSQAAGRGELRLVTWWDPWSSPLGRGYQTLQALFAMRGGGWEGLGFGGGFPHLTPLVGSDFVYAAITEEFGLLGCGLLLLLYVTLFRRGYRLATLAEEPFRQRLAVGCVTVLAWQTLLNIGGVVRWVPLTGITLPFVSHGGSSLVVSHALLGLVLAVGHEVEMGEPPAARRTRREARLEALDDDLDADDPPRGGRESRRGRDGGRSALSRRHAASGAADAERPAAHRRDVGRRP